MNDQVNLLKQTWQTSAARRPLNSEDKLLVYVKMGKPFTSQLQLLRFPEVVFSVLVISSKLFPTITKEQVEKFACVLQVDKGKAKKNWRNLSDVYYDDVAEVVAAASQLAPFSGGKYLITLEEPLVRMCAQLRTLWGFNGLQKDRVALFVDKLAMKQHCDKTGIKTAASVQLTSEDKKDRSVDQYGKDILAYLSLPLYVKPQHGCASVGHRLLPSPGQLRQWLLRQWNQTEPYLIEETIEGEEFTVYMFVQDDEVLHSRMFRNEYPVGSFVTQRMPVCKLEVPTFHRHYEKVNAFASQVTAAWTPIPNGVFFVQLFLNLENEECTLVEVCCRLPGGKYPEALFRATSVDLEEMHILASVQSVDFSEVADRPYMALFRYPRKAGRVLSLQEPESLNLKGTCLSRWRVSVGDVLEDPRGLAGRHEAISIILLSNDYEELMYDYNVLLSRYNPLIVE